MYAISRTEVVFEILHLKNITIGLWGNILVIFVLVYSQFWLDDSACVTNIYKINLAIADTCILICSIFDIEEFHLEFGVVMCYAYFLTMYTTYIVSMMFIVIIAAYHYFLSNGSINYRTMKLSYVLSIGAWVCSILIASTIIMLHMGLYARCELHKERHFYDYPNDLRKDFVSYHIFMVVMKIYTLLCFIVTFYYLTIKVVRNRPGNFANHRKSICLVITTIAVYISCLLPYSMGLFEVETIDENYVSIYSLTYIGFIIVLFSLNSGIRPFLHFLLSQDLRRSFEKAFLKLTTRQATRDDEPRVEPAREMQAMAAPNL